MLNSETLHHTPYTLYPIPYTLYPTPYILHPTSCNLCPMLNNETQAGGYVVNVGGIWRVTTASGAGASVSTKDHQYLAVSRSFGDTELKQPTQLVIATPEIKV